MNISTLFISGNTFGYESFFINPIISMKRSWCIFWYYINSGIFSQNPYYVLTDGS